MNATKEELIEFLEENVLIPVETNADADATIKRKVNATRMRLNNLVSAEKVEQFFGVQWQQIMESILIKKYQILVHQLLKMLETNLKSCVAVSN
jgi:hypothetical protein